MNIFKNAFIKFFAVAGLGLLCAQPAHALVGTSIKGGLNFSKFTVSSGSLGASSDSRLGYEGGLGLDFGVGPIGVIGDVLYASRSYSEGSNSSSILLPVQARFGLAPMFSLTAGGYYEKSLEDGGSDDYGLVGGLRVELPVVYVEGRYSYGLKDFSPFSGITGNTTSMDLLVGVKF